jgi:hypothetical protein
MRDRGCGTLIIHGFLNTPSFSDSPASFSFPMGFATVFSLSVSLLSTSPGFQLCTGTTFAAAIALPPVATPAKQETLAAVFTINLQQKFDNHLSRIANPSKTCFTGGVVVSVFYVLKLFAESHRGWFEVMIRAFPVFS